ncbi:MAG: hypothetical protein ACUZ77_10310 [Candidatus Brocadiales bacterium]
MTNSITYINFHDQIDTRRGNRQNQSRKELTYAKRTKTLRKNIPLAVGFGSSRAGLDTVGYQLKDINGNNIGARVSGAAIKEIGAGYYQAWVSIPDNFTGGILWDTGDVGPRSAYEEINPIMEDEKQLLAVGFGNTKEGFTKVGYQLKNADGSNNGSRITTNIVEIGYGYYQAIVSIPDNFIKRILWDTGEADPKYVYGEINRGKIENTDVRMLSRTEHSDLATQMKEIARQVSDGPKNQTINIFFRNGFHGQMQTGNNPVSIQHQNSEKSIDKKANKKISFMERFQKLGKLVGVAKIIWDFFKSIFC